MEELKVLNIREIAHIIEKNWPRVGYAARPYLNAMHQMDSIDDGYYADSGREVVARFLCNAKGWRGEFAKAVKDELKSRCK